MVSRLSKIGIGLTATFAVALGYHNYGHYLSDLDAILISQDFAETHYGGTNTNCAPINSPESFTLPEDQEMAKNLLTDIQRVPTGRQLLEQSEDRLLGQTILCFSDTLESDDRGLVSGFHKSQNIVFMGEALYSRATIVLKRNDHYPMLATLGHELGHNLKGRLIDTIERQNMAEGRETLLRLSDEAFARATAVQIAVEFEFIGISQVLSENYINCESSENCSSSIVQAYMNNYEESDTSEAIYNAMLAWSVPYNIRVYGGGEVADITTQLSLDITAQNCEEIAAEQAPDFLEVDVEDRSLIARYIRPLGRSFYDEPEKIEYMRANTLVRQLLQSATIANSCEEEPKQTTSSAVSAPAQP